MRNITTKYGKILKSISKNDKMKQKDENAQLHNALQSLLMRKPDA